MKTPEEWAELWRTVKIHSLTEMVRQSQQEAFLEGQLKGLEDGKQATMKVIDEVFGAPVKSELTSID